jgi:hypothetical protein
VGHPTPDEGGTGDADPKPDGDARKALRAVAADTLRRMVRRVTTDARRAAATPGRFLQALDAMHARHAGTVGEALAPLALGAGAGDPHQIAAALVAELRGGLLDLSGRVSPAGLRAAVAEWCDAAETNIDGLTSVAQLTGW